MRPIHQTWKASSSAINSPSVGQGADRSVGARRCRGAGGAVLRVVRLDDPAQLELDPRKLVAIVDGLTKRDLRRWGGGRESSFVYHWAKRSALPLLVLTWVIYLALPFSLHPSFGVLPFATLFALSVAVTASTFKKYL